MKDYSGYKWIKVKKFKFDDSRSWEENYKELENHHIEETKFLINEIRDLNNQNISKGPVSSSTYTGSPLFTCPQHPLYDGKSVSPNACVCCWDLHYIMKFLV